MPDTLLFHVFVLHNPWQMYLSIIYEKTETEWYRELSWDYKVRNVARIWTLFSLNPTFLSEAVYILSNIMPILILNPVKVQLCPRGNICGTSLICGQLPSQCGLKSCQNAPLYLSLNWETFPLLLLLLPSLFSRVRLCVTPQTAAHQAPPSLRFSRQEHWSGLPFPSPVHESEKWKLNRSVVSDSLRPHGPQPTSLLHPWDFPDTPSSACNCWIL